MSTTQRLMAERRQEARELKRAYRQPSTLADRGALSAQIYAAACRINLEASSPNQLTADTYMYSVSQKMPNSKTWGSHPKNQPLLHTLQVAPHFARDFFLKHRFFANFLAHFANGSLSTHGFAAAVGMLASAKQSVSSP